MAQGNFYSLYQKASVETEKNDRGRGNEAEEREKEREREREYTTECGSEDFLFSQIQVVQDVGSQSSNTEGLNGSASPIIQRKLELDKVRVCMFICNLHVFACVCHNICS